MSTTATLPPATRQAATSPAQPQNATMAVLLAVSAAHMVNDLLQSLLPAIYPILAIRYGLSFAQIGMITLVNQLTASVLQPLIGTTTDRWPFPAALPLGMAATLVGLLVLANAGSYAVVLMAVALVGIGSSVFHPESSRVARAASGGQHGFAQSIFQVGGNAGAALGPLMAALVIAPNGQHAVAWFGAVALVGIALLSGVSRWAKTHLPRTRKAQIAPATAAGVRVPLVMGILLALMFSKFCYMASFSNFYTFYLIHHFGLAVSQAQLGLFAFLASVALGTLLGGPIGDRIGRKRVIWGSILGVLPLSLLLPHMGLWGTIGLSLPIGLMLASAFPAIVVYAQDLLPGRTGMVSGLMFGLAFGLGGIGAALLGRLADAHGIDAVYQLAAFLPALGLLAAFLPELGGERRHDASPSGGQAGRNSGQSGER